MSYNKKSLYQKKTYINNTKKRSLKSENENEPKDIGSFREDFSNSNNSRNDNSRNGNFQRNGNSSNGNSSNGNSSNDNFQRNNNSRNGNFQRNGSNGNFRRNNNFRRNPREDQYDGHFIKRDREGGIIGPDFNYRNNNYRNNKYKNNRNNKSSNYRNNKSSDYRNNGNNINKNSVDNLKNTKELYLGKIKRFSEILNSKVFLSKSKREFFSKKMDELKIEVKEIDNKIKNAFPILSKVTMKKVNTVWGNKQKIDKVKSEKVENNTELYENTTIDKDDKTDDNFSDEDLDDLF